MNTQEDKIKKAMGQVFEGFEAEPPDGMWNRIDRQLKRRKKIIMFRWAAMAASVIILLGVGFSLMDTFLSSGKDDNIQSASVKSQIENESGINETGSVTHQGIQNEIPENDEEIILSEAAKKTEKAISIKRSASQTTIKTESVAEIIPGPTAGTVVIKEKPELVPDEYINTGEMAQNEVDVEEPHPADLPSQTKQLPGTIPPGSEPSQPNLVKDTKKWGIAMNYAVNPAMDLSQKDFALNAEKGNFSHDALSSEVASETSYFEEVEQTNHRAPISLGIMVGRQITGKWSLESGIIFTKLAYQARTGEMNFTHREYNTEIFYLGLPLAIRYHIAGRKKFGLYATQMLITEKGISSRITTETFSQGSLLSTDQSGWPVRGIQLSSLSALGGDVKLAGNLSFYGQAGVQIFFLNKSQPYNIRSARMAWPSIHAGLRMNFN